MNESINEQSEYEWHGFTRMQFNNSMKNISISTFTDLSKLHDNKDIYINIL